MSKPRNKPWYASGLAFECTSCGNCCTGPEGAVWFDDQEGREMAEHLGMSEKDFLKAYTRKIHGNRSLNEHETEHGFDCVFLDRETKPGKAICSIYEVRPVQCRTWPFWPEVVRSRAAWDRTRAETPCPGMGKGKVIKVEEIVDRLHQQRSAGSKPW